MQNEVPRHRSRYMPANEQRKIGTIILMPNCVISVKERITFLGLLRFLIHNHAFLEIIADTYEVLRCVATPTLLQTFEIRRFTT